MKKETKIWTAVFVTGGLMSIGLGALIYMQSENIVQSRAEVEALRTQVTASRKLIEGTAALEREVIVQREMSEHIRTILPDEEDMNNWVRTIQGMSDDSGVRIRGLKKKPDDPRAKPGAFDNVSYTFTLEADAFQFLDFLNLVETHSRFMRVPHIQFTAAKRGSVEESGFAAHKVKVDIETFVYEPKNEAPPVKIDGYERKRDLMLGEINRRRQDLTYSSFTYRGARGRRDPWVDPRVPAEGGSALSVPEQMDIVQQLFERMQAAKDQYALVQAAQNVIEERMARDDLEVMLGGLETEVRRLEAENAITYLPSQRRMQLEVLDAMLALRQSLTAVEGTRGPSVERLREVLAAMEEHLSRDEYELALDTYRLVDEQLDYVEEDPLRRPFVEKLRKKALVARIVRDFEGIPIDVGSVAISEGGPSVANINGRTVQVGEMLTRDLLIHEIRTDEIQFVYRGVILARRF
ncbi:MAG: hypothetical protein H6828_04480 [Planctomycetes bacterium]|nr:hypothetical protein [Planctomycetota bacterium]